MAHDIQPNTQYSIVTIKLALATTCSNTVSDGLNQLLNPEIGEGFIADYAFYNMQNLPIVTASDDPEEGELFADTGAGTNSNTESGPTVQVVNIVSSGDCLAIVNGKLIMNTDGVEQHDGETVFNTAKYVAEALNVEVELIDYTQELPEDFTFSEVMTELKSSGVIPA